jgi:hypothetical protein
MGKNIISPFYRQLTNEQLLLFGVCFDEYVHMKGSPNHRDLVLDLIKSSPNPERVFFRMLGKMMLWDEQITRMIMRKFMRISLSQMPLYILEYPEPIKKVSICPPPIPGRGPLSWQVIFSRWRLLISL